MKSIRSIAERFCCALDAGDWDAVGALLHPDCDYECRGTTCSGAAAIVDSYRTIDAWVHATFDHVEYESGVEFPTAGEALITFRDRIDHGEHHLDFRCQQRIAVGDDGRIQRITHIDLPGEAEKADRFNRACGVRRPGAD